MNADEQRFTALYERHYDAVARYVARRAGSVDVPDVVSSVFLVTWRKLDEVPKNHELPWLYGVARRVLANQLRGARRADRLTDRIAERQPTAHDDQAEVVVARLDVAMAFDRLSAADQEVLRLIAWEQLTPGDAARVLGCGRVAFAMRLQRARGRLKRLLATPRTSRTRASWAVPSRRRLVLAAGLAAVTAVTGAAAATLLTPPEAAYALTPPPLVYERATDQSGTAGDRLRRIADRAAAAPAPKPGRVEHLKSSAWYLKSAISSGQTASAVVPEKHETWRAPDGSGRMLVQPGKPLFESDDGRLYWRRLLGAWEDTSRDETYRAGEFAHQFQGEMPTGPAQLRDWLRSTPDRPVENFEVISKIDEVAADRVLQPGERAALLRLVASLPGLTFDGLVTDRAGRRGEAYSVSKSEALPARYTLIVDPADGRILAYEEMLTTTPGLLKVKIPAVITYRSHLVAEYEG